MKYHKPSFFDQFKCIGSACTDTCCAGWEIEVDETTAQGYLAEKGAFGDRLRREIGSEPGEYFFKLKNNRCPFLNKENLCDIFINLGEDRLCDICREHPRFYNWFGDYTEVGLGLCCEEAERLLFSDSKPLTFVEEVHTDASDLLDDESEECEQMLEERKAIFSILQNRKKNIGARLKRLLLQLPYADEMLLLTVPILEWDDPESITKLDYNAKPSTNTLKSSALFLIRFFGGMESLDKTWPSMMKELEQNIDSLIDVDKAAEFIQFMKGENRLYEYEHIAVYLVYRYYPEILFDGQIEAKILFAAASICLLFLMDLQCFQENGVYTQQDRIELVRRFSKEIEYCPENMERFEKCCTEQYEDLLNSIFNLCHLFAGEIS
ncbi:MAG: flagellin lysine-N-methylase [Lachnospiraceae bacterium]